MQEGWTGLRGDVDDGDSNGADDEAEGLLLGLKTAALSISEARDIE